MRQFPWCADKVLVHTQTALCDAAAARSGAVSLDVEEEAASWALFEVDESAVSAGGRWGSLVRRSSTSEYGTPEKPFYPYSEDVVNDNIAHVFETKMPLVPLRDAALARGEGVYALYYLGENPLYTALPRPHEDGAPAMPIYVGKAATRGARKGAGGNRHQVSSNALADRLVRHRESITQVADLDPDDFLCRWMVTAPMWVRPIEELLIDRHSPVWNTVADGFGNHDPGRGRQSSTLSRWDTLHPGRFSVRRGSRAVVLWADQFQQHPDGRLVIANMVRSHTEAQGAAR